MAGSDIRDAAARVFGLLSDEERRKRRLTTMMDRLRQDGFVEPRSTRPVQGPTVASAADAIGAGLIAGDALRTEAERQLQRIPQSAEQETVDEALAGNASTRAALASGSGRKPSQAPEGGELQKAEFDAGQFRRLPDNPVYDSTKVVIVGPKGHHVYEFQFEIGTTLLGITMKNISEVPAEYPEQLPETWLYTDFMVGVVRRMPPGLPDEYREYEIHANEQLELGKSATYGKTMKSSQGTATVLIHNRNPMAIELTIGAVVGDPT